MGDTTTIAWTDRTWNPWRGCSHVSPGCDHCYMFADGQRWGWDAATVARAKTTWRHPFRWQREAQARGTRARVFVLSLSDFFHPDADAWRDEAWAIMRACDRLDFQVLTKRDGRIARHLPADWGEGYANVWLGVSIEADRFAFRADTLRRVPARVRFISAEPLLEPLPRLELRGIDWLIVGGESGLGHRPMEHAWAGELYQRAQQAGTAFFFKQSSSRYSGQGTNLQGLGEVREFPRGRCL